MLAIIFELFPAEGRKDDYLAIAASLRDDLHEIDGFLGVERFQSLVDPDKLLSISFWRDEEALANWRRLPSHRKAQTTGRAGMFRDYRLRVAGVIRDYGMFDRDQAPEDSKEIHCPVSQTLI